MKTIQLYILLVAQLVPGIGRAAALDSWVLRQSSPTQFPLYSVVYGDGTFVAVGDGIVASTDGTTWTGRQYDGGNTLRAVVYGNGQYVAVGEAGTVVTSTDTINWTQRQSGTQDRLYSIAYANGRFVVVGDPGTTWFRRPSGTQNDNGNGTFLSVSDPPTILISSDGVNWSQVHSDLPAGISLNLSLAYGAGMFVAIGQGLNPATSDWETIILTSTDGANWTERRLAMAFTFPSAAYGSGKFVAVGWDNSSQRNALLTSTDGVNWILSSGTPSGPSAALGSIAYGGGQFVAAGESGTIVTSTDGVGWVQQESSGTMPGLAAIAYGGGQFVAVGGIGNIVNSVDGSNWILGQPILSGTLGGVAYGKGQFVAGGWGFGFAPNPSGQTVFIMSSSDGIKWSKPIAPVSFPKGSFRVCFGNDVFVATANDVDGSSFLTSTNGVTWNQPTGGTWGLYLWSIAYGSGRFVAAGNHDTLTTPPFESAVRTSSDGVDWETHGLGARWDLHGITYGNGQFVAVGGAILTSPDGTNWRLSVTNAYLNAITFGGGQFVAVGNAVLTSSDGLNWVRRQPNEDFNLNDIAYGGGQFVAVGDAGRILTSADGLNWRQRSSGITQSLRGVAYGDGRFLAVGEDGIIVQSGPIINLSIVPGRLSLSLEGPKGLDYTIQSSMDLISWRDVRRITGPSSGEIILDGLPGGAGGVFYRAQAQ